MDKAAEQAAGDGRKPRNGLRAKWETYKKEFAAAQLQRMFEHHRRAPWFAEKYDPAAEFAEMRARVRKAGWRGRVGGFVAELEAGAFDPAFDEQQAEPAKENASAAEEANANGKGEERAEEGKNEGEDAQMEDAGGDEEAGKNEANGKGAVDTRRTNRGEEVVAVTEGNQVMIRTIPPDIGRVKLEDVRID